MALSDSFLNTDITHDTGVWLLRLGYEDMVVSSFCFSQVTYCGGKPAAVTLGSTIKTHMAWSWVLWSWVRKELKTDASSMGAEITAWKWVLQPIEPLSDSSPSWNLDQNFKRDPETNYAMLIPNYAPIETMNNKPWLLSSSKIWDNLWMKKSWSMCLDSGVTNHHLQHSVC